MQNPPTDEPQRVPVDLTVAIKTDRGQPVTSTTTRYSVPLSASLREHGGTLRAPYRVGERTETLSVAIPPLTDHDPEQPLALSVELTQEPSVIRDISRDEAGNMTGIREYAPPPADFVAPEAEATVVVEKLSVPDAERFLEALVADEMRATARSNTPEDRSKALQAIADEAASRPEDFMRRAARLIASMP